MLFLRKKERIDDSTVAWVREECSKGSCILNVEVFAQLRLVNDEYRPAHSTNHHEQPGYIKSRQVLCSGLCMGTPYEYLTTLSRVLQWRRKALERGWVGRNLQHIVSGSHYEHAR